MREIREYKGFKVREQVEYVCNGRGRIFTIMFFNDEAKEIIDKGFIKKIS